jgi:hypothetical protein
LLGERPTEVIRAPAGTTFASGGHDIGVYVPPLYEYRVSVDVHSPWFGPVVTDPLRAQSMLVSVVLELTVRKSARYR